MVDSTQSLNVDIDAIATDLNGKLDRDCSNYSNTGYNLMAGASMPSNSYINLTLGASGTNYTAPANGYFDLRKGANAGEFIQIQSKLESKIFQSVGPNNAISSYMPVLKGDIITVIYDATGTTYVFRFIYAQGSVS